MQFPLQILGVALGGQQLKLHELEAGLHGHVESLLLAVDVADAVGVGRFGRRQLVDVDLFQGGLSLLEVDRVPPAFDHVADLDFVVA